MLKFYFMQQLGHFIRVRGENQAETWFGGVSLLKAPGYFFLYPCYPVTAQK
jgi:hypothetical protein